MATIQLPTRDRHENLNWTRTGQILATYFVCPLEYGLRPKDDKEIVRAAHESLSLNVPDRTLYLGTEAPLDLVDSLHRSLDGVDTDRHQDHVQEALASYHRMTHIAPTTRIFTATFPLGEVGDRFDPTSEDLDYWLREAHDLKLLVDPDDDFGLQPVPEALLPFLWNHNLMRGTATEVMPPDPVNASPASMPVTTRFRSGVLDEGARSEKPWFRRFDKMLKTMVRLDDGDVLSSYQTMLTPTKFRASGMRFPGQSEFLSVLDGQPGISVDWAMLVHRTDRESSRKNNEKALDNLGVQLDQRSLKVGYHARDLRLKVATLTQFDADMADDENAEEINFTTVLAVGAPNNRDLRRNVKKITKKYRGLGITLSAPRGAQNRLWHMFNPGAPGDQVYKDYEHIMTSPHWGGLAPFTTARLLDDNGPVIGVNLLSGHFEPLHFNFIGKALNDSSPAIALAGEQGAGKTYFVKTCAGISVDLGGQFLAIDRSKVGEYTPLLDVIPGTVLIDLTNPGYTLDPLQLFVLPETARRIFLDTVMPMLNVPTGDSRWQLVARLLRPGTRSQLEIKSSADLKDFLIQVARGERAIPGDFADQRRDSMRADCHALVEAIEAVEARVIFDREDSNGRPLKPMPLSAPGTIVRTHGLSLPDAEEMTSEVAMARMPWSKRLGHALYELVGHLAREQFVAPTGRFGMLIVDEAYHFTASAVGREIVNEFVRQGRVSLAGLMLASHDPSYDYTGVAHGLIPNRFAFRHRNKKAAENTLDWLGVDLDRERYLLRELRENTSPPGRKDVVPINRRGECFIRDSRGRIGRGKLLGPAMPDRAAAYSSTPILRAA
ncbi:ATP-binding protein [Mycobacteroides abscessus]|uniref:ATP-binding protein n=1 Tax=Mycobacteroides abscessus TaxID=36809 RepID=UPI0009A8B03F|nr:ATP-binding protein [Mycobacteroides abscessus]SLH38895.1 Type IV secretory pathway, VirB4 components [Mycobacteroides abscessus subsp. massiliense]